MIEASSRVEVLRKCGLRLEKSVVDDAWIQCVRGNEQKLDSTPGRPINLGNFTKQPANLFLASITLDVDRADIDSAAIHGREECLITYFSISDLALQLEGWISERSATTKRSWMSGLVER